MWKEYLSTLYQSFFSAALYRRVAHEWEGFPFGYLLLLAAIAFVPLSISGYSLVNRFLETEGTYIIEQIPDINIDHGKVQINAPEPYYIYSPENEVVAILDTTGKHTSLEDTPAIVLLTQHQLLMRENEYKTEIHELGPVDEFFLNRTIAQEWAERFSFWMLVVFMPFLLVALFVIRLVQTLIYAGVSTLLARLMKVRLHFDALLRLAAVALTPAVAVNVILGTLGGNFNGLSVIITLGYLYFALKKAGEEERFDFL